MIPMHSIFPRGNQSFALGGILDKKELIYVVLLNSMCLVCMQVKVVPLEPSAVSQPLLVQNKRKNFPSSALLSCE